MTRGGEIHFWGGAGVIFSGRSSHLCSVEETEQFQIIGTERAA